MEGTRLRGKTYEARKRIPDELRESFGKREFKQSLGTGDFRRACELGAPLLREWDEKIVQGRDALKSAAHQQATVIAQKAAADPMALISPSEAEAAFTQWRKVTIDAAYLEHFNNLAQWSAFTPEATERGERRYKLQQPKPWNTIADFDHRLLDALESKGMVVAPNHPVLSRLRRAAGAWRMPVPKRVGWRLLQRQPS